MFKIGEKVRVTTAKKSKGGVGTMTSHNFTIGQVVTVEGLPDEMGDAYKLLGYFDGSIKNQWLDPSEIETALDLTKPVYTIEGTPVQIISTAGRDTKFPVLAYEGKAKNPSKYDLNGNSKSGEARRDLTNEVPKEEPAEATEVFVNVYAMNDYTDINGDRKIAGAAIGTGKFASEAAATAAYKTSRARGNATPRTGVAKLVMVKGDLPK